jgi:hypothetical protein
MIVYSIEDILKSFEQDSSYSLPFLESFVQEYSEKVSEDEKTPLFSYTTKYNNFPVRSTLKKKEWRTEKIEKTIIKKENDIRENAIRILNKLTFSNFEEQSQELLDFLIKNKQEDSVSIIANIIFNKICYDNSFYELYYKLCSKLWSNNEWTSGSYKIYSNKKGFYYNILISKEKIENGPFKTQESAIKEASSKVNLRPIFLGLCKDVFYKREYYINEYKKKEQDSTEQYLLKRRLFGCIEIIGYFYLDKNINEDAVYYIIHELCTTTKYDEEIEALKILWDIIKDNIKRDIFIKCQEILRKKLSENWSRRTRFMIEDMVSSVQKETCKESKDAEILIEEFIILSRKNQVFSIRDDVADNFVEAIIKDSFEYENYLDSHFNTLINILDKGFMFPKLSRCFDNVYEDLLDIKIDAPRAPQNIATLITKILEVRTSDNIRVSRNEEWVHISQMVNNIRFVLH